MQASILISLYTGRSEKNQRLDNKSRMTGDCHVRLCESLEGKLLGATRQGVIKQELKEIVRRSVEETLNNFLDQEAAELTNAERYERTEERQGYRSGHYERNLTTTPGNVKRDQTQGKGCRHLS